jgi:hypothetical protein
MVKRLEYIVFSLSISDEIFSEFWLEISIKNDKLADYILKLLAIISFIDFSKTSFSE